MKYDIEKMLSEIKTLPRRYNLSYVQLQSCKENPEPQDAFENVATSSKSTFCISGQFKRHSFL